MATITGTVSGTSPNPYLFLEWRTANPGRSVIHPILDRATPQVTLRPAGVRSGTLRLFYSTQADALACVALHRNEDTFTFNGAPESAALVLKYVVAPGGVELSNADPAGTRWTVDVSYQEVL